MNQEKIVRDKVSKFYTVLSDESEELWHDDNSEEWMYWFQEDGLNILNNFPSSELFNVGDVVDIHYSHVLFENKIYSRNFYEDWKTTKFRIKKKTFFYNNVDYINDEEIIPDFCPEPVIFYEIELIF